MCVLCFNQGLGIRRLNSSFSMVGSQKITSKSLPLPYPQSLILRLGLTTSLFVKHMGGVERGVGSQESK